MRTEVRDWVGEQVARISPEAPVLEVGAYNVNGTIRDLFPAPYVGIDSRFGPGVDHVIDICNGDHWLYGHFKTVICVETLEHIRRPWEALAEMHKCLAPGGWFISTWCFDFPIHEHPMDFWRVTPEGFKHILCDVGFSEVVVSTQGGTDESPVGVFATARRSK